MQSEDVKAKVEERLHVPEKLRSGRGRSSSRTTAGQTGDRCTTCGTHLQLLKDEALTRLTPTLQTVAAGGKGSAKHSLPHQQLQGDARIASATRQPLSAISSPQQLQHDGLEQR